MNDDALDFLLGGGEMGARMRAMDWSKSPLGAPSAWPQNLRTCVRIVLTSRQPMFVWWGDSLINLYNDAYKAIVGGKHPEALGQPAEIVWREIWDQVAPRVAQTIRGHEGTYDEALLLIMERNGYPEETYYTFSYSPVPNDQGGTGGIICANTDDTKRIIGERQVKLQRDLAARTGDARRIDEALSRTAVSLASEPRDLPFSLLYLLDAGGTRATLAAMSGIDAEHPAAPALIHADDAAPWPVFEAARKHEIVVVDSGRFADLPCGAWTKPPARIACVPIASSGRMECAGTLVVGLNPYRLFDDGYRGFLDLVGGQIAGAIRNAQAYEEEKKRAEALAELDRAKTAFFSNVSHEFRTPLTLMLGPTEDALASSSPRLEGESLRTVHRNALRLLKLVNALLDFSRIESGRINARYRPTNLAALTADLASVFRSAVERAQLRFEVSCEPLPESVFVDRDMWETIVLNLISNALKFTFEGAIAIRLRWAGDAAELTVEDTGTGIPESELPHLFERFHRVQGARSRTHEGSGIGLALVNELVRLHGGTIEATSAVGRGTTFTVRVPRGSAHLPPDRVKEDAVDPMSPTRVAAFVEEALRWLPSSDEFPPGGSTAENAVLDEMYPKDLDAYILVADDNADMRDYVTRLLRPRWTVEAVADGQEALAAVKTRRPDLVLTDVMMPHVDGFGVLRGLKNDPSTCMIPVVMLSARAGEESRVEGLEAGADDYLPKPFSARELIARVATHLQLARLRRVAEDERRKLHDFLMQAPIPVAVLAGPEPMFELTNPAYCAMLHRSDLQGKLLADTLPEVRDQPFFKRLEQVLASGESFSESEASLTLLRDGSLSTGYFDITVVPIIDSLDRSRRAMCVAIDVTDKVLARRRIEALREAAEQASRAKDEFLSTLSHELRTPLNAIVGWSTLLQRGNVTPQQIPKVIETIDRNARVQARLIEDLLELSRIEQGKLVLSVGPVEMVRVVRAAIEACVPAAEAKGVRLQPVLDSHATIVGDPDRLQQVAWNLVSNAIKFTPRGGRVHVRLRREHSYVEFEVSDTGEGIDASFLPFVFDRFRQADGSSTRKYGGLGLGLAIVRSVVELHGGTVQAESAGPGRGATFTIRVPTAPLRADRASTSLPDSPADVPAPVRFTSPPELRGLRILVVDDEPETLSLLDYVIAQCEARVSTASGAAEALSLLQTDAFDILVSDVGMPNEDGHSLVRKVRTLASPNAGIPAVALTAYARSEDRTAAFLAGFDVHLSKPIDPSELLIVMARLVGRHRGSVPTPID